MPFLQPDTDRPLLLLMAEHDEEAPSSTCDTTLPALKQRGAPVEWFKYPDATHCWDCSTLDGLVKTDFRGRRITNHYDKRITETRGTGHSASSRPTAPDVRWASGGVWARRPDMDSMCDMHRTMMHGKSSAEQQAMIGEHMRSMSPEARARMQAMLQRCSAS